MTIETGIEISSKLEEFELKRISRDELRALFSELEFNSFEKKLFGSSSVAAARPSTSDISSSTEASSSGTQNSSKSWQKDSSQQDSSQQDSKPSRVGKSKKTKQKSNGSWVERVWNLEDVDKKS